MEEGAALNLLADIAGGVEKANVLSTDPASNATLPKYLLLLINATFLEMGIVSGEAARILANILNEELAKLVVGCGRLLVE